MTDLVRAPFPPSSEGKIRSPLLKDAVHVLGKASRFPVERYAKREFDLLGSGWVNWSVDSDTFAAGLWPPYREAARELSESLRKDIPRINWRLDPKSGHEWSAQVWYKVLHRLYSPSRSDLKLPWELGRLQFLLEEVVDALAQLGGERLEPRAPIVEEYRTVVLDFISANPVRWGVQWVSSMDVAIRVVNLTFAYDLLESAGAQFDEEFRGLLSNALEQHGRHVYENLETSSDFTGNHFLANITGLACAAVYLPHAPESDEWLRFAYECLLDEFPKQFNEDGSNFEGSTCYHRLSTELVLVGTSLIIGAQEDRRVLPRGRLFSSAFVNRLWRAVQFSSEIAMPDGSVPQIGDNDSGRLITAFDSPGRGPRSLAFGHLSEASTGLFARTGSNDSGTIWSEVIRGLANHRTLGKGEYRPVDVGRHRNLAALRQAVTEFEAAPSSHRREHEFLLSPNGRFEHHRAYPDFGLYVWSGEDCYLAVRCGPVGQNGRGGHSHNDQLHAEIWIRGGAVIRDPGSFVYTADPSARNAYRSAAAHFVPRIRDVEPAGLDEGLFYLSGACAGECLHFDAHGFVGEYLGYEFPIRRIITLMARSVRVLDYVLAPAGASVEFVSATSTVPFSPRYGELEE